MLFRLPSEEELTDNKLNEFIAKHNAECAFRFKHLKDAYETDYQIFHQKPKPDYKPDNRIAVNFAKYMVDTFNGYFIGNPIKISVDDDAAGNIKKYVELLDQYNDQDDNNAELSKICCIYGKGYEMYYVDELGNIGITYLTPFDAFMIYDDSVLCKERYFVRLYIDSNDVLHGSVSDDTKVRWFTQKGKLVWEEEKKIHGFDGVPATEYAENKEHTCIFEPVMSMIDAYNKAISEKSNDVDYFADAYMKILGTMLGNDEVKHIRDNRIINFDGDANQLIVDFLNKPDGDTTQEHLIDRLEKLIFQIGMVANISDENFGTSSGIDDLQKYFDKKLTKRTLDEFRRQAGILGKSIMKNEKYAHAIVNASFKNATYSDRIWMYHGMLKAELEGLLASGLIKGENPRKLARHLTKRFGVSAYNAERLMVTELTRVQTEAQKQSFIRNGFDEYVYVACTKGDVCPICKGLDDKHFKVDDMMPGENAPPMHPNCHCSTAAYMDDKLYKEWLNSYKEHGLSYEEYSQRIRNEELKLSDSTDKWAREAKRELHKSEQSIGKRTKETMEIYDANGKFIMSKRGGESSVRISLKDYTKLKNAVVTHNHPSGGSFSFTDLKFLKRMPISELRVAASNGAYYIRKPDKWPEELKDIQYMEEMYKQIEKSLKLKYQRLYNERKITKRERYQMYRHDVNKTFSERYGLEYGYETYE